MLLYDKGYEVKEDKFKSSTLSFLNLFIYQDKEKEENYQQWRKRTVFLHISIISFITAFLYILYTGVSLLIFPKEQQNIMILFHIVGVACPLFIISFFARYQRYYKVVIMAMMLAPVVATLLHYILLERLGWESIYFPEVYLILIWTFIISGLSLLRATVSAIMILSIAMVYLWKMSSFLSYEIMLMHIFWLCISVILGFMGAILLEWHYRTNFIQHQILQELATTDALTGLNNRTRFREFLQDEIQKAQAETYMFGLMMIDIDFFKEVNDMHGHIKGDCILTEMADLLKNNIRKEDKIIRWGGEEFMVICPIVYVDSLMKFANKICAIIAAHVFHEVGQKTVSIGITCFSKNDTIDSILERVDRALHQAKQNGRNRVVFLSR